MMLTASLIKTCLHKKFGETKMVRQKVKMKCEETGEFYFTTKNKTLSTERLLKKRYSRKLRKHVNFKESK